ncbi:MAG: hypothetical protein Q9224_001499 [Gallowayella concinna]
MSEDQDLLARIGQLAGHINLHKAQSPSPQTITHEQTSTRSPGPSIVRGYASWRPPRPAPYHVAQGRGRGAHRPYSRNRSLVVKNTTSQSAVPQASQSTADTGTVRSSQSEATYVTTNGRHRQYINASILPKVTEQRKRAIEDSQHRKALTTDRWERQRMHQYLVTLDQQRDSSVTQESPQASSKVHEIMIEGLGFRVLKGGSKLARVYGKIIVHEFHRWPVLNALTATGPSDTSRSTPKRAYVQGVTFVRSKQGNLHRSGVVRASNDVASRVLHTDIIHSFLGHCNKGPACLYQHNPTAVAMCSIYLQKGTCPAADSCDLSHEPTPERVPACIHFLRGKCSNLSCRYAHVRVKPSAPVCKDFASLGYCGKGADCSNRHIHECPDYANAGACRKRKCDLPHVDRAGQIRKHAANSADTRSTVDGMETSQANDSDLSSDEDDFADTDGDDIDSDDLNDEFIEGVDGSTQQGVVEQDDFLSI